MLNFIWLGLIVTALIVATLNGTAALLGPAAIDGAKTAVTLAAGLVGVMSLWLGMMRLAAKAGLIHGLGRALRPILGWLFPEIPVGHPALGAITLNVAANLLGLDNAATPLGLRAMAELERLNPRPGTATNAMCMVLAINTSSVTLIPATAIAVLAAAGSTNPTRIIASALLATMIAHAAAILTAKVLENRGPFRLPPAEAPTATADLDPNPLTQDPAEDWMPGSRWILWGLGLLLVTLAVTVAFSGSPDRWVGWRLLDGFSALAMPALLVLFPVAAALRRVPVYEEFVIGAREGFHVALRILPYVVGMLMAIGMFRASGGMTVLANLLRPLTDLAHIPPEVVPMALIRPFSSGAALGLLGDLAHAYPPDSLPVLIAATFYGCSETTFYVIAVYFGAVNIRKTRHAVPAGLVADILCPLASVLVCTAMFGGG